MSTVITNDDVTEPSAEATPQASEKPPSGEILLPGEESASASPRESWDPLTVAVIIIAVGVVVYAMYSARAILFPLTLAAFVALPLRPIMRWMRERRIPRFVAAGLLIAAILLVFVAGAVWLSAPAKAWLQEAPTKVREVEAKLRTITEPLEEINQATVHVEKMAESTDEDPDTVKVEVQQPRLASTMLNVTGGFAMGAMITISMAFLLLVFGDELLKSLATAMPTRRDRRQLQQMFFYAEQTISRYLLTFTAINIGLGMVIGTALWLMGMPNPVLWGVMAAVFNYVPFVGLVAGTAVVFLVALLTFDSTLYACLAPAIYLIANGIEVNVVTPTLLGRSMKMSPVAIFASVVVGGWIWGIGGAIIAVPALAVAKIVFERHARLAPLSALISG